ncbi:fasciclin domain-containing protein [Psychroserpens burtonensis]|uniref:Fasciclin domain-containing protein n=1 Tax=Psychroserpens burtonensis TaxID=49278 RepID=A0A5C7BC24_9FLAO|nr:fasciclin domain-containing protein [Psychroserpens burtonensis]TXE20347.1 fasciclin domain-containing protein [Psychroserpens burtonensis]
MKILKTFTVLAVAGLFFASCGEAKKNTEEVVETEVAEASEEMAMSEVQETPTIVGVAAGNENFSTLVAAVKAADLVDALNGEGPLTVFAPTNAAFAKLPEGTVATLLMPENKSTLAGILTYHVVAGKFEAAAVIDAINSNEGKFTVDTLNGGQITLSLNDGNVILTDANGGTSTVVIADVAASNGVIHAIDSVVMPK